MFFYRPFGINGILDRFGNLTTDNKYLFLVHNKMIINTYPRNTLI